MKKQDMLICFLAAFTFLALTSHHACGASYDLSKVKGIQAFGGSGVAKDLLSKNGFVVTDPTFKQIFEAYRKPTD